MFSYAVKQWNENKNELAKDIKANDTIYENITYFDLVKRSFGIIFDTLDIKKIREIDDGYYQGTKLFLIHEDTYQPDIDDYYITYIDYGSCSACDALEGAQSDYRFSNEKTEEELKVFVKDILTLCMHLVQNFRPLIL